MMSGESVLCIGSLFGVNMKILLGMSGGLDSTYAAYKLLRCGHEVEGAVLKMHAHTEISEAELAARDIGIPIHVIDATAEFESSVVKNFISEYLRGRTPNPCVVCNSEVKFRLLLAFALENGFDAIATGHYAEIVKCGDRYAIKKGKDSAKDQSYMLWRLSQDILAKLIFPLADEEKKSVREEARAEGILSADRDESQEICFIPSGDYAEFIESRTFPSPHGKFVDREGKILGEHKGIIRYTVGQRKGLGIALGERVFVTDINVKDNTVTLSPDDSFSDVLYVSGAVFSGIEEPKVGQAFELSVKVRYLAKPVSCTVEYLGDGCAKVNLALAQRAVTAGQSAVFYQGDLLVFGAFIDSSMANRP